jgi:hypothetical protein
VAAFESPLDQPVEQRITTADSTESLIRFCKQIGFPGPIAGKIKRRIFQNYPAPSAGTGFFTVDY